MELNNEINSDTNLIKQNSRLRKEIATYQDACEEMEVKLRIATKALKDLQKKFSKVADVVAVVMQENVAN